MGWANQNLRLYRRAGFSTQEEGMDFSRSAPLGALNHAEITPGYAYTTSVSNQNITGDIILTIFQVTTDFPNRYSVPI